MTVEGLDGARNGAREGGPDQSETLRGAEDRRATLNAATGALAGLGDPLDVARFAVLTASIDNALQELARAYSILHEIQSVESGATPKAGTTRSVNARLRPRSRAGELCPTIPWPIGRRCTSCLDTLRSAA